MRGNHRQRVIVVTIWAGTLLALLVSGSMLLMWLFLPEISLASLINLIRPYLPLRYGLVR